MMVVSVLNDRIVGEDQFVMFNDIVTLVKLDKLGLIELLPKNRVHLLTARRIQWRKDGMVRRMYERDVKQAFLQHEFAEDNSHFGFESAGLAPESARMISRKLANLSLEFDELAELDVNLKPDQKRGYGLMVALRPWAYWNIVLNEN